MLNETSGSQGDGKEAISENKTHKGYYEGVAHGIEKTKQQLATYFEKYLDVSIKGEPTKIKQKKFDEFWEWLWDTRNQ